jgi:hypothetical protein
MNRRVVGIGVAVIVAVFASGAWAQTQGPLTKIGFSFSLAGKQINSGKYAIEATPAGHVVFKTAKGVEVADVTPLKSLGRSENVQQPKLVFDVVGADRFLVEVWLPGQEGYLVGEVTGAHEQQVLGGSKGK